MSNTNDVVAFVQSLPLSKKEQDYTISILVEQDITTKQVLLDVLTTQGEHLKKKLPCALYFGEKSHA